MTWVMTPMASLASGTDATSYVTASYSPAASRLLVAFIETSKTGSQVLTDPAVSGNSVTWSKVAGVDTGAPDRRLTLWVAKTTISPVAGALTASFGANTQAGCSISVFQIQGADTSPAALDAVLQFKIVNTGGAQTLAATLDTAPASGSRCVSGWRINANITGNPRANWTEIHDLGHTAPVGALETQWRSDAADQIGSVSWSGTQLAQGIVAELKAVAGFAQDVTGAANLSGQGSLSVYVFVPQPTRVFTSDGDPVFNGVTPWGYPVIGTFTADGEMVFSFGGNIINGTASLAGVGSESVSGIATILGTAALQGQGVAIASASGTLVGRAALSGTGTATITGKRTAIATVSLSGTGTQSITGKRGTTARALLTGTGTSSASGTHKGIGEAHLSGIGSLIAAAQGAKFGRALLSGTGTQTVTGTHNGIGAASLAGTSGTTVSGTVLFRGLIALLGFGFLDADGNIVGGPPQVYLIGQSSESVSWSTRYRQVSLGTLQQSWDVEPLQEVR